MKKCIQCKNLLPVKVERCSNCGQEQPVPKESKRKRKKADEPIRQTDFENYYEDIVPEDTDELKNRKGDNDLTMKFVLLGFGVAIVLAACIAILILLEVSYE